MGIAVKHVLLNTGEIKEEDKGQLLYSFQSSGIKVSTPKKNINFLLNSEIKIRFLRLKSGF